MSHVSIIGLGLMGKALARALMDAGHRVTVWNRTPDRADDLVARGAVRAATVTEAVQAAPVTIVCVLDYPAVDALLEGVPLQGRVIVNLTSGRPAEAREMGGRLSARGAAYVDGGIMAIPPMIGNPGALILYSGDRDAFERYEDLFKAMAEARFFGTDPGMAPLLDLAMLTGMYGQIMGFLEAAALVESAGVPVAEFTTTLLLPWMRAMAETKPEMAKQIESGDYSTDVSNLEVNRVGVGELVRAFEEQGAKPTLLLPLLEILEARVARGHGAEGLAGLIEELRGR